MDQLTTRTSPLDRGAKKSPVTGDFPSGAQLLPFVAVQEMDLVPISGRQIPLQRRVNLLDGGNQSATRPRKPSSNQTPRSNASGADRVPHPSLVPTMLTLPTPPPPTPATVLRATCLPMLRPSCSPEHGLSKDCEDASIMAAGDGPQHNTGREESVVPR